MLVPYIVYIVVAIVISFIFLLTRDFVPIEDSAERSIINGAVSWCMIIYTIVLGFTISNFYTNFHLFLFALL